jgi:AbrB family looped-hinge helix DNA binding protein
MMAKTKIYPKYQTTIPKEIRKKLNLKENNIIEWDINKNGKVELTFRKKVTEKDIAVMIKKELPYDSVEIKKRGAKGLEFQKK